MLLYNNIYIKKMTELLLSEEQRYTLFPIKYPKIWDMYKKQLACFWVASEIDFSKDLNDWNNKLSEEERYFIKHILAFFAGSDGIVGINILDNFSKEVKILEAQMTYNFQGTMESIHSEVYSLMIETYINNHNEKNILFNAITEIPCIKKKADWALSWIEKSDKKSFAKRLVAFAIMEGLFFSGAFCAIYWIKERGILPGLTKSNEFIARDERLHTEFACLLYSYIENKLDKEIIYNMIEEAVEIETEFIVDSLPIRMIGMNSDLMTQYIKYVADWLLNNLGYPKKYNINNPFSFMNFIGMESKSNFFEERTSTYQKASVFNTDTKLEETDDF
jgi:ribonucleoside-diphosphate reductase subunit M2